LKTDFNSIPMPAAFAVSAPHPTPDAEPVRLAELAPGESGTIARVESDTGIGRRLLDLGFIPGTPVRVVRRAPLGDPVVFELRGVQICLRRTETVRIWVDAAARRSAGA
jgi:ferrous iron transport protein A